MPSLKLNLWAGAMAISVSLQMCQATIPELYQRLQPYAHTPFIEDKIKFQAAPDFMRVVPIKDEPHTFISFTGGSHIADLFIIYPNKKVATLATGPIYAVMSKQECSFLEERHIFIVTTTGGSGLHSVYGLIVEMDEPTQPVLSLPLHGYLSPVGILPEHLNTGPGSVILSYEMTKIEKNSEEWIISGVFHVKTEGFDPQQIQEILKFNGLEAIQSSYEMRFKRHGLVALKCHRGARQWLEAIAATQGVIHKPDKKLTSRHAKDAVDSHPIK